MEDNYREVKKEEPCLKLIHMDQVEVKKLNGSFIRSYHTGRSPLFREILERVRPPWCCRSLQS